MGLAGGWGGGGRGLRGGGGWDFLGGKKILLFSWLEFVTKFLRKNKKKKKNREKRKNPPGGRGGPGGRRFCFRDPGQKGGGGGAPPNFGGGRQRGTKSRGMNVFSRVWHGFVLCGEGAFV